MIRKNKLKAGMKVKIIKDYEKLCQEWDDKREADRKANHFSPANVGYDSCFNNNKNAFEINNQSVFEITEIDEDGDVEISYRGRYAGIYYSEGLIVQPESHSVSKLAELKTALALPKEDRETKNGVTVGDLVLARASFGSKLVIATVTGFTPKKVRVTGTTFGGTSLIEKFETLENVDIDALKTHLAMFNSLVKETR